MTHRTMHLEDRCHCTGDGQAEETIVAAGGAAPRLRSLQRKTVQGEIEGQLSTIRSTFSTTDERLQWVCKSPSG